MEQVQWGIAEIGTKFFSEKSLALKFNVSLSTSKNALQIAEALGLLSSIKGKGRIVNDFSKQLSLDNYLTIKNRDLKIVKKYIDDFNKNELLEIHNLENNRKKAKYLIIDLFHLNIPVAKFYSITYHEDLFNTFIYKEKSFLDLLKKSKTLVSKIVKTIYVKDGKTYVSRKIFDINNMLIEDSYLEIVDKYFIFNEKILFPFIKPS